MDINFQKFFEVLNVVYSLIMFAFLFLGAYLFIISIFAWRKRNQSNISYKGPVSKFALVIAAHNEENVIKNILDNLKILDYPKEMYDVFVVADNCTDKTAEIARKSNVYVYERFNKIKIGKGFALEWMFNSLFSSKKEYDAVCVFDADNLVATNFLTEIDKKLVEGYKIVQGYRDIKNPFDSWITTSYAITYWISNRLFQLPRYYLGMSSILTGSGYAIRMDTLKKVGWGMESLTEDIEFSIKVMLKGLKIGWAHEAVIYDEQPITLSQSWIQRKRWMQGHAVCAFKYIKEASIKFINDKTFTAFDNVILILYPFILVFGSLITFLEFVNCIVLELSGMGKDLIFYLSFSIIVYLLQNIYFLIFIKLENKYRIEILNCLVILPIFNLTWIPIIIQGIINRNDKKWAHITHVKSININEL